MDVEQVADELYDLTPEQFTTRRNARVDEARRGGERDVAEQVRRLPRPTMSAWLGNLLARRSADELGELLGLGARLREAQQALAGDELRRLGSNRHRLIAALAQRARELAGESGHAVAEPAVRELEATLEAAVADPGAAAALRSGRLVKPLQAGGFGPVDVSASVALPDSLPPEPAVPAEPTRPLRAVPDRQQKREAAAARRELDAARTAAEVASREHDAAQHRLPEQRSQADAAAARVTELEQQLFRARRDKADAEKALRAAERAAADAERTQREAQRRLHRAEGVVPD